MQLPAAPLNQYEQLHHYPSPPEHFSIAPIWTANGNDFASTLRQSKVEKRKGIGGCWTVDQGREDGSETRRWQGNNIPFSSIDRDHNSCLSRDRLRKAIAQGAVKHGCWGELKVKRKTQFAVSLPLFQPTDCQWIFFFFFSFQTTVERLKWYTLHIDNQPINLHKVV